MQQLQKQRSSEAVSFEAGAPIAAILAGAGRAPDGPSIWRLPEAAERMTALDRPRGEAPRLPASTDLRKAIILAAGSGQRLRPLTEELPKCLIEVEGEPILLRTLSSLAQYGIRVVVMVIGHHSDQVIDAVG